MSRPDTRYTSFNITLSVPLSPLIPPPVPSLSFHPRPPIPLPSPTYVAPPLLPIPDNMAVTCNGSSKGKEACACTVFIPRRSKETKCKGCGHRMDAHINSSIPLQAAEARPSGNTYINRLARSLNDTAVHEAARKETLQGFRPPPPQVNVPILHTSLIPFSNTR